MNDETKIVLDLDLDDLTQDEQDWLHALRNRVQMRRGEKQLKIMREGMSI